LSVDAFQLRSELVCVMFFAARPLGVDGGVVSAHAVVETMTEVFVEWFPTASYASTASV
jgi:hypothetical protein